MANKRGNPTGFNQYRHAQPAIELFEELFQSATPESGCIRWPRERKSAEYPQIKVKGKVILLHRMALERKLGRPLNYPTELACHECDEKWCINPYHLTAGTSSYNKRPGSINGLIPEDKPIIKAWLEGKADSTQELNKREVGYFLGFIGYNLKTFTKLEPSLQVEAVRKYKKYLSAKIQPSTLKKNIGRVNSLISFIKKNPNLLSTLTKDVASESSTAEPVSLTLKPTYESLKMNKFEAKYQFRKISISRARIVDNIETFTYCHKGKQVIDLQEVNSLLRDIEYELTLIQESIERPFTDSP